MIAKLSKSVVVGPPKIEFSSAIFVQIEILLDGSLCKILQLDVSFNRVMGGSEMQLLIDGLCYRINRPCHRRLPIELAISLERDFG